MCDFKPGDEVVCVEGRVGGPGPRFDKAKVYVVADVVLWRQKLGLVIEGMPSPHPSGAYGAQYFRKVQRKRSDLSIETFLTIKPGFEEPKRAPVKKRERVQ